MNAVVTLVFLAAYGALSVSFAALPVCQQASIQISHPFICG